MYGIVGALACGKEDNEGIGGWYRHYRPECPRTNQAYCEGVDSQLQLSDRSPAGRVVVP